MLLIRAASTSTRRWCSSPAGAEGRIVEMDDIPAEGESPLGPAQSSLFDLAAGQGYNTSLLGF
jgi:hypothetical protein